MTAGGGIVKGVNGFSIKGKQLSICFIHRLIGTFIGLGIIVNLKTGAVIYVSTVRSVCISLNLTVSIGSGTDCLGL